ncbi:MAG TPA: phospholipid carrier-dependent glycosyltransferase [Candidatus Binataceae bacterium]|nr:phospholipid carrier-dependent glycosyltransferase [Candidatus Binataceae bacterium]
MKRLPPRFATYLQLGLQVLLVAFLTTNRLDASTVCGANEAVEAVFVQQMVENGHWLFPLDNGSGPMYKPPLFHWTATALDRLAGIRKVNTFNLRLPAALYATAGAALMIGFALSRFGPASAALSGLILAASYEYISQGRVGRVDMTLAFFEALSLFSFLWWLAALEAGRSLRRITLLHFLFAASMGLGVLAKGPVGAILPGLPIGLFLVFDKRWVELRRLMRPLPVVFGAALASSWYAICLAGERYNFLSRQVGSENFGRFFGSLGRMPFWYYAQPLLLNAGPISLLIPVAVITAIAMPRTRGADSNRHDNGPAAAELDCVRLFALFWIVTVVFFELAAYKRKAYLLPLWPPSAILLAWWTWRIALPRWGGGVVVALVTVCVAMTVVNFLFIPWREIRDCGGRLSVTQTLEWPFLSLYGEPPSYVTRQDSLRSAARQIEDLVGANQPLFAYRFDEALEPWIFSLDREIVPLDGPINLIPSGYVLVPLPIWYEQAGRARGFSKLLTLPDDQRGLVLLHHEALAAVGPGSARQASANTVRQGGVAGMIPRAAGSVLSKTREGISSVARRRFAVSI